MVNPLHAKVKYKHSTMTYNDNDSTNQTSATPSHKPQPTFSRALYSDSANEVGAIAPVTSPDKKLPCEH